MATLSAGTLTIDYTASGTTSETVTLTNDGTNINLTGNVTGAIVNPVGSVNKIVVQDSGGGTNQRLTLAGTADYSLSAGLQISGVDILTVARAINASGTSNIAIAATNLVSIEAQISLVDGDLTLNSQTIDIEAGLSSGGDITLTGEGGHHITQSGGTIQAATGILTINAPGGYATFNSIGNKAAQLVIGANAIAYVNGSFDSTGFVQVDGTLSGKGSAGVVTVLGTGRVRPSGQYGLNKLTTGNIALNAGSIFEISTGFQLVTNGTINLGGATLNVTLGLLPASNQVFKIIDNQGSGDVSGTFNGYSEGSTVVVSGVGYTLSYHGGDGNDVTLTAPVLAPRVDNILFGDGTGQRSMVRQMVVNFSEPVSFVGDAVEAFTLFRAGPTSGPSAGPTGFVDLHATPNAGPTSSVTITFSGSLKEFNSLRDGFYNLTIDASMVSGIGGALDGGAGQGSNFTEIGSTSGHKLFRLFGDGGNNLNGNGVGAGDASIGFLSDFVAFRNAFNTSNTIFDSDDNGIVDFLTDFIRFRRQWA